MERDILSYINERNDFTYNEIDVITNMIMELENVDIKKELTEQFFKNFEKHIIKNKKDYTNDKIIEKANYIKNKFDKNVDTKNTTEAYNFSGINVIKKAKELTDNNFVFKDVPLNIADHTNHNINEFDIIENNIDENSDNFHIQEDKEITKIETKIKNLTNEINNEKIEEEKYKGLSVEDLENKLKNINEKISHLWQQNVHIENSAINDDELQMLNNQVKDLEEEIKKKKNIENYKDFTDKDLLKFVNDYDKQIIKNKNKIIELNQKLNSLNQDANELWTQVSHVENGETQNNELSDIIKKTTAIKEEIKELENQRFYITKKEKIEINEEEKKELMSMIVNLKEYEQILNSRLKKAIEKEETIIIEKQLKENKENLDIANKKLNDLLFNNTKDIQIETNIDELKIELNRRTAQKYKDLSTLDILEIKRQKNETIQDLWHYNAHQSNGQENNKLDLNLLNNEVSQLEYELNRRNSSASEKENNLLEEIKNVKNAYYAIINDSVKKFTNNTEDKNIKQQIEYFVNSHKDIELINNYEYSKKLKNELIEEIKNKLNINQIDNKEINNIEFKENNKKKWMKALASVAGFATGLGVSCVPGVGTIGMIISTTKLTLNITNTTLNFFSKNQPEGLCAKITKLRDDKIKNLNDKFNYSCPKISETVNFMREKLKSSPVNCFINGVAVGYITGNVIELITGKTAFEHINSLNQNSSNIAADNINTGKIETIVEEVPSVPNSSPISNATEIYDLSSIPRGFGSSYSDSPVNLITKAGKNVTFDKANWVNGEEWWHFLKADGDGYAWFKADDVRKLVENTTKISGKSI